MTDGHNATIGEIESRYMDMWVPTRLDAKLHSLELEQSHGERSVTARQSKLLCWYMYESNLLTYIYM